MHYVPDADTLVALVLGAVALLAAVFGWLRERERASDRKRAAQDIKDIVELMSQRRSSGE